MSGTLLHFEGSPFDTLGAVKIGKNQLAHIPSRLLSAPVLKEAGITRNKAGVLSVPVTSFRHIYGCEKASALCKVAKRNGEQYRCANTAALRRRTIPCPFCYQARDFGAVFSPVVNAMVSEATAAKIAEKAAAAAKANSKKNSPKAKASTKAKAPAKAPAKRAATKRVTKATPKRTTKR